MRPEGPREPELDRADDVEQIVGERMNHVRLDVAREELLIAPGGA
jgi:hypothetical protein